MPSKNLPEWSPSSGGVFQGLALRIKLILRLMADPRVNLLLKLLPAFSIAYLFIPDLVIGPLDDAAVVWLGFTLFVELCPPEVVEEHMRVLRSTLDGTWREPTSEKPAQKDEIIEAEFQDVTEIGEPWDNGHKEDHGK
jgi:uncharacterized membrane protein YkvA (DUF1232 family)